jgi:hypothetical protein
MSRVIIDLYSLTVAAGSRFQFATIAPGRRKEFPLKIK